MKAAGEPARLTYDTDADVEPGDLVRTTTGRLYLVRVARLVRSRPDRSGFANRYALDTTVLTETYPVDDADVVHPLAWNRR